MHSLACCGKILDAAAPSKAASKSMDLTSQTVLNKSSALFANVFRRRKALVPNGDAPPHAFGLAQT